MKIDRTTLHPREPSLSRRRPPSFGGLKDLIAQRRRLRIGLLLAICLPLGWLLLHVE